MLELLDSYFPFLLTITVGLARITPAFLFLPFLNERTVSRGALRGSLMALISLTLWPVTQLSAADIHELPLVVTLMTEAIIGLMLGIAMAAPWFAMQACGELIDNQRGATMANAIDPATGIESSPLASFPSFLWTAVFLAAGGMQRVVGALAESYRYLPVGNASWHLNLATAMNVVRVVSGSILTGVVVASPAMIAMLLSEILLGMMARVAPQLNPFSVALTVKSIVACAVLWMYLGPATLMRVDALFPTSAMFRLL